MADSILNTHPFYSDSIDEWYKYRLVFGGGRSYINQYLYKFSDSEEDADFEKRRLVTYKPNHAKRAILKIRDAVFQRMVDVKRDGGPDSYIDAVAGLKGGINNRGMSIGAYIGLVILPELLSMGRAFVFVDKAPIEKSIFGKVTLSDALDKTPYLTLFRTEDVVSWTNGPPNSKHDFTSVMLREWDYTYDENAMPNGQLERYRKIWINDNDKVMVQYYDSKLIAEPEAIELDIDRIPLVKFEIQESLMVDIADYQIALLNLVSADMQYLLNANTGIYVEQYDPKWDPQYTREGPVAGIQTVDANGNAVVPPAAIGTGSFSEAAKAQNPKIKIGHKFARRYTTLNQPDFISPSTDPLLASMKKQDQLISDIERLVNLQVENLSITGEAKKQDRTGLESGLSTIGLVLQTGENQVADYWAMYEGGEKALVTYPSDYSLKTDGDRIKDANDLIVLKTAVPSATFAKQISMKIAHTLFDGKITPEIQNQIDTEITSADYTTSDPDTLVTAHQEGFITAAMGAKALGFSNPDKLAADAQEEQAKRLATIAVHQQAAAGARGVADMQQSSNDGKNEKLVAKQKPKTDQKTQKE